MPGSSLVDPKLAYGFCHALTAALLDVCPAGEILGLYIGGECVHSILRVPRTSVLLDAHGAEPGEAGARNKAARYMRAGDVAEWKTLSAHELIAMVPIDRARNVRQARPVARELLRQADAIA